MSIVKSYSFKEGEVRGDMFYIKHNSSNFTVIDCNLRGDESRIDEIISEIIEKSSDSDICRFILTHPDSDHYRGIEKLFDQWDPVNTYAVYNDALKDEKDPSAIKCREMIQSEATVRIEAGLKRAYLNLDGDKIQQSGIEFLWPVTSNSKFIEKLEKVAEGNSPNDISPVILYRVRNNAKFMWMGDMETDMQKEFCRVYGEKIKPVDILFAPHHGRKEACVPDELLEKLNPKIIVVGNAPSENLAYHEYGSDKTITQNSAGDIVFKTEGNMVHVFTTNKVTNLPNCLHKLQSSPYLPGMVYHGTLTLYQS